MGRESKVVAATAAGVALFALLAAGAGATGGRRALPNLVVTKVSDPPKGLSEGDTFRVTDTTRNAGTRPAGATVTRYYLTTNPKRSLQERAQSTTNPRTALDDILLIGPRKVGALGAGKSSAAPKPLRVEVPGGTPGRKYFLLACADDRGSVVESKEADNCKASKDKKAVTSPQGTSARIDAFSDTTPDLDESDEDGVRLALALACLKAKPKSLTLAQAIASANAFLKQTAGADALTKFKQSPDSKKASAAEEAAGESVVSESPGAALAALLRAHALEPREATHLVNAAGLAAAVGLPNEALAFLDAAAALDTKGHPAMGVGRQAQMLATRGYALLQIGKYAEAERALQAALAVEPLLDEAQATLAGVKQCRGKDPIPAFRKARRRKEPPEPPKLPIDEEPGKVTELRPFPFPFLPENALGGKAFYEGLVQSEIARGQALVSQRVHLAEQLQALRQNVSELTDDRIRDMDGLASGVPLASDLKPLEDQLGVLFEKEGSTLLEWQAKTVEWQGQAYDACTGSSNFDYCSTIEMRSRCIPGTKPLYQQWLNDATNAYQISQQYQRIYSKHMSAIASNFENQVIHDYFLVNIPFEDYLLIGNIVGFPAGWARGLDAKGYGDAYLCVDSPDPAAPEDPGTPPGGTTSGPCPPNLKAIKAVLDLGVAKIKVNCEEIKAEASTKGWIQAFGEVKYTFRGGSVTVFAGSKGEVGLGPLKADFKSGIYVKADSTGFKDVGWRVGPQVKVGAGPVEFGKSDYMDFTFVGALSTFGL